jgi:replication factor A1
MRLHYALVDDLFGKEEFEQLVVEKIAEAGGLLDEHTAAMLVVRDAGRQHCKIARLASTSSLICFFGKVLQVSGPKEFDRNDGTKGQVSRITVGDDSGEITVVLWDERAAAVCEIEEGEVLEIFGRLKGRAQHEVHALDMRQTAIDIATRGNAVPAGAADATAEESLEVVLLAKGESRQFTRRDGSAGEMAEAIIGDERGTARLVCWAPFLLEGIEPGSAIVIGGARAGTRSEQREYSIGEQATISVADAVIDVPVARVADLREGNCCTLSGEVVGAHPPRSFVTRRGEVSWVRNVAFADESGRVVVVLWGDHAKVHLITGDRARIYHATVKAGRSEGVEVHVGWSSAIRVMTESGEELTVEGTVIDTSAGRCIDTGERCLILDGDLPLGAEVRIRGICAAHRITPVECTTRVPDVDVLKRRLRQFLQ